MDELLLAGLFAIGLAIGIIVGALATIGAIWLLRDTIKRDLELSDD